MHKIATIALLLLSLSQVNAYPARIACDRDVSADTTIMGANVDANKNDRGITSVGGQDCGGNLTVGEAYSFVGVLPDGYRFLIDTSGVAANWSKQHVPQLTSGGDLEDACPHRTSGAFADLDDGRTVTFTEAGTAVLRVVAASDYGENVGVSVDCTFTVLAAADGEGDGEGDDDATNSTAAASEDDATTTTAADAADETTAAMVPETTPAPIEVVVTSKLAGMTVEGFELVDTVFKEGVATVLGGSFSSGDVEIVSVVAYGVRRMLLESHGGSGVDVEWKVTGLEDTAEAQAVSAKVKTMDTELEAELKKADGFADLASLSSECTQCEDPVDTPSDPADSAASSLAALLPISSAIALLVASLPLV